MSHVPVGSGSFRRPWKGLLVGLCMCAVSFSGMAVRASVSSQMEAVEDEASADGCPMDPTEGEGLPEGHPAIDCDLPAGHPPVPGCAAAPAPEAGVVLPPGHPPLDPGPLDPAVTEI